MASAAASRGPLNALLHASAGTQWLVFGAALYTYAAPDKVMDLLQSLLLSGQRSLLSQSDSSSNNNRPIIIHTSGGGGANGSQSTTSSLVTTVVTYCAGAGAVWVSFTVLSNLLPDYLNQLLPVTRRVFDRAAQNLAQGIHNVKDVLGQQILKLMRQQDELGRKQDETGSDVKDIQENLRDARGDLNDLATSIGRCEVSLEEAQRLQTYTARGVKLLVRSVSAILPTDDRMTKDLQAYAREVVDAWPEGGGASTTSTSRPSAGYATHLAGGGGPLSGIPVTVEASPLPMDRRPTSGPENEHPHQSGTVRDEEYDLREFMRQGPLFVS